MPSIFQRKLKPRFPYKVPLEISIPGGKSMKYDKVVKGWSKSKAKKAALALALKDIKVQVGDISRVKNRK